jgi:mRNA-degrading endonuclease RelE of RelBE toxin-antitoxin system
VTVVFTRKFLRQYRKAPPQRQRQFDKQLRLLLQDVCHPSLRARIYDKQKRIWQARVDGGWRFYFQIRGDVCYLLSIQAHP